MTISTSPTETKRLAIDLRKKGYSYSEIQNFVSVPKSTLGVWLKKVKLSSLQLERVRQKRILGSKRGAEKKSIDVQKAIDKIRKSSAQDIKIISTRELWLLGIMLYWKRLSEKDIKKGVHFTSSDPFLIRFFLRWLFQIGRLTKKEIMLDLFVNKKGKIKEKDVNEIKTYWSRITHFSVQDFTRTYQHTSHTPHGMLRVRVRASSMLSRQIAGWIQGIQKIV